MRFEIGQLAAHSREWHGQRTTRSGQAAAVDCRHDLRLGSDRVQILDHMRRQHHDSLRGPSQTGAVPARLAASTDAAAVLKEE